MKKDRDGTSIRFGETDIRGFTKGRNWRLEKMCLVGLTIKSYYL